jgi:hypothetical protein
MQPDKEDDGYLDDDLNQNLDPDEENWEDLIGDEDLPEKIEWLEEIDNGDLDDYSFEDDFDELDLNEP